MKRARASHDEEALRVDAWHMRVTSARLGRVVESHFHAWKDGLKWIFLSARVHQNGEGVWT
eukprot:4895534-Pleurochrysis_carterae.AAC.4